MVLYVVSVEQGIRIAQRTEVSMQLTERHIIKSTEHRFAQIDELAFNSKNLYNAANYVIRQSFIYGWGYVSYNEMNRLMKSHEAYKAVPAKVSQQILMVLDKNWKSFFEAVKAYKADSSKFTRSPEIAKVQRQNQRAKPSSLHDSSD